MVTETASPPNTDELRLNPGAHDVWSVHRAISPLIGTAIHNGHSVRSDVASAMAIDDEGRLREEDPFTEFTIRDVPNRVIFHRSRFEVDLNRDRAEAVYVTPEQAWGLKVWSDKPAPEMVEQSLHIHDSYYAMLGQMLDRIASEHGKFVLLDVHSYNHRRNGPDAAPTAPLDAPVINIGTSSMDRARWAHVVDPFIESLRSFQFRGGSMDVRENIAFQGRGEQTRFVHQRYPKVGCAIAIEFKKIFMDEWTGEPDRETLLSLRSIIRQSLPVLLDAIEAHG